MKLLFDLFPVILFFAAFKIAEDQPDAAIALAERFMGEGLTAMTAPVFIATVVAIAATFLQVGWLMLRGRKVEPMLWISLAVIVVFGSLTLYLRNEMFIKWKPTILTTAESSTIFLANCITKVRCSYRVAGARHKPSPDGREPPTAQRYLSQVTKTFRST